MLFSLSAMNRLYPKRQSQHVSSISMDGRECAQCGAKNTVLIQMDSGKDGQPWWLCVAEYVEGIRPMKCGRIPAKYREDHHETTTTGTAVAPVSRETYNWKLTRREPPRDDKPSQLVER